MIRFIHCVLPLLLFVASAGGALPADQVVPLPSAHSHNDYYQPRPLLDALDHGFCGAEADIFLVDRKLLVGHAIEELDEQRTLESAYLEPLRRRVAENNGHVFSDGPVFMLLIDIKEDGPRVYARLSEVLARFGDMLSSVADGVANERAVQVVISGDRPQREIEADNPRYVGIDGRLSDLDSTRPAHLMPLVSDRWPDHFSWTGEGEFPPAERDKLRTIVDQAHAAGRRIRFWATPESPAVWRELRAAGVDHINTDKLDELREFLLAPAESR